MTHYRIGVVAWASGYKHVGPWFDIANPAYRYVAEMHRFDGRWFAHWVSVENGWPQ